MNNPTTLSAKKTVAKGKLLSTPGFSVVFVPSIKKAGMDWETATQEQNVFLQKNYLCAIEENPPEGMKFGYLLFYKNQQPVGASALQVLHFKADRSLNLDEKMQTGTCECFFRGFGNMLKSLVASQVEFNTLVCGNLLVTGEHGYYFQPGQVTSKQQVTLLKEGLDFAQEALAKTGIKTEVVFVKEFFKDNSDYFRKNLEKSKFSEFCVQPNMIFNIQKDWKTFDDYLNALSSKYRVRAKRAFKKSADIQKLNLDEHLIGAYRDRMFELYAFVAENAGFNLVQLHPDYLPGLKKHLGEDFQITGYFLNKNLIGFYTTIKNGEDLEAHFLGYDAALNGAHQIYLNMLFDLIKDGIETGAKRLNLARTALEIKSSIGAEPHDMFCYIRHSNSFANRFIKPLVDYLNPQDEWMPRNPFKEE